MKSKIDVDAVIAYLQGTTNTLSYAIDEITNGEFSEDDLTIQDHDKIANEIFCCKTCNWWCEISEQSENGETCVDCAEE